MAQNLNAAFMMTKGSTIADATRKNTWEVIINQIPNAINFAKTVDIPKHAGDREEIPHFNMRIYIFKEPKTDTCKIDFIDPVGSGIDLGLELYNWYQLVHDGTTGVIGMANAYKSDGLVRQYDTAGNNIRAWQLKGMLPLHTPVPSGLDYGDGGASIISVEFSVDVCLPYVVQ